MGWPRAARDHQTFCVSCHTAVPYALSRPILGKALAEQAPSVNERKLLDNVVKRVRLWKEVGTFYTDQAQGPPKTAQSRGTESVLNALILASYDAPNAQLAADTRSALDNMWQQQQTTGEKAGAWLWLDFGLGPWEAGDSEYYGATLAAIAVGVTPGHYSSSPEIQPNLTLLRTYLQRQYAVQSLHNRLVLLWASTKLSGLLDREQEKSILREVAEKQQADGGWSLASLVPNRKIWTLSSLFGVWKPREEKSDGYATGLIALALQQAGVPADNRQVKQGLHWLAVNQSPTEGLWLAYSLNQQRSLSTDIGRFMSDAATAYAVLALSEGNQPTVTQAASAANPQK